MSFVNFFSHSVPWRVVAVEVDVEVEVILCRRLLKAIVLGFFYVGSTICDSDIL